MKLRIENRPAVVTWQRWPDGVTKISVTNAEEAKRVTDWNRDSNLDRLDRPFLVVAWTGVPPVLNFTNILPAAFFGTLAVPINITKFW